MVSGSRSYCSISICNDGSVYSTGYNRKGDNGLGAKGARNRSWQRIECLKDIIDWDFGGDGGDHSESYCSLTKKSEGFVIFLSSSGRVFSAGDNQYGQLG
eukprot:422478_1